MIKKSNLSNDSISKIISNPLRILDSKNEDDIEISKQAPSIYEFISQKKKNILKKLNLA